MNRLLSSVKKELLLLKSDMVGLLFMFAMPLLLVVIITIVQDSAFRQINENQMSLLIINHDSSEQSAQLITLLEKSRMFDIEQKNETPADEVKNTLIRKGKLTALYIPENFSEQLNKKAALVARVMLADMGLFENNAVEKEPEMPELQFYHDPVLQDAYSYTIVSIIRSHLDVVENSLMIDVIYQLVGIEKKPDTFRDAMMANTVSINQQPASKVNIKPNTTQHNIPAWTIFAMFFIVVSLGSNIVKERMNGSFIRLKTMPVNFSLIFGSKMIVYVSVAVLQVVAVFSVGVFLFPVMNLPQLILPGNFFVLFIVVLIIALAAVSYALMIGALSKTQEQANGIGAVSIIIFAALGGILVPVFVMPDIMKIISNFSPLYWCLESFYFLFLKGGNWTQIIPVLIPIIIFILLCQMITYIQLKVEKII